MMKSSWRPWRLGGSILGKASPSMVPVLPSGRNQLITIIVRPPPPPAEDNPGQVGTALVLNVYCRECGLCQMLAGSRQQAELSNCRAAVLSNALGSY
jgi:hypothetical protein